MYQKKNAELGDKAGPHWEKNWGECPVLPWNMWEKRCWYQRTVMLSTWARKVTAGRKSGVIWRVRKVVPKMLSGLGFCRKQVIVVKTSALGCESAAAIVPR